MKGGAEGLCVCSATVRLPSQPDSPHVPGVDTASSASPRTAQPTARLREAETAFERSTGELQSIRANRTSDTLLLGGLPPDSLLQKVVRLSGPHAVDVDSLSTLHLINGLSQFDCQR